MAEVRGLQAELEELRRQVLETAAESEQRAAALSAAERTVREEARLAHSREAELHRQLHQVITQSSRSHHM